MQYTTEDTILKHSQIRPPSEKLKILWNIHEGDIYAIWKYLMWREFPIYINTLIIISAEKGSATRNICQGEGFKIIENTKQRV